VREKEREREREGERDRERETEREREREWREREKVDVYRIVSDMRSTVEITAESRPITLDSFDSSPYLIPKRFIRRIIDFAARDKTVPGYTN
jgi:hypothetical protein